MSRINQQHCYTTATMVKPRGRQHTTLTQTARLVVRIIERQAGIKMIAPGEIAPARSKSQRITITYTKAGAELNISGTGIQKVAIHTISPEASAALVTALKNSRQLQHYTISERMRAPGM